MLDEEFRNRFRLLRRDNEIEIAHDLFPTPITSGDANMQRFVERAQIVLQRLRFRRDLAELKRTGVFHAIGDGAAKFLLRRFAEPGQLRDALVVARFLQLRDRADRRVVRRAL